MILIWIFLLLQVRDLVVPMRTGASHSVIVWTDLAGMKHKVIVPGILLVPPSGPPPKPMAFTGTDLEWAATWNGRASVTTGRATLNTPSGDYEDGSVEVFPSGELVIHQGPMDIVPPMNLKASEYTGKAPNINANKCGVSIAAGRMTGRPQKSQGRGCREP